MAYVNLIATRIVSISGALNWHSHYSGTHYSGMWLLPVQRWAVTWTSADFLSIWPKGTNFREIMIKAQTLFLKKKKTCLWNHVLQYDSHYVSAPMCWSQLRRRMFLCLQEFTSSSTEDDQDWHSQTGQARHPLYRHHLQKQGQNLWGHLWSKASLSKKQLYNCLRFKVQNKFLSPFVPCVEIELLRVLILNTPVQTFEKVNQIRKTANQCGWFSPPQ